ncbi:MAG: heavy-metal-associated domain-containing protein [Clostridia bacterium]|nr:heavy-metal-associated domain-containing protein [Clostridia bacterium]
MKRIFKLENLGCAHCAAKMERAIAKLAGVQEASINFMTQKLIVEADEALFPSLIPEMDRICRKFEPDCHLQGGPAK